MSRLKIPSSVVGITAFSLCFSIGFFLVLGGVVQGVGKDLAKLERYRQEKPVFEPQTNADAAANEAAESLASQANALLPTDPLLEAFAVQIEALAKKSEVTIASLTLSPAVTGAAAAVTAPVAGLPAGTQRSVMNLSITGKYAAIQNFVFGISQLNRLAAVESVSLGLGNPGTSSTGVSLGIGSDPSLTAQLTLAAYSLPYAK